jgi:hypothetical protein
MQNALGGGAQGLLQSQELSQRNDFNAIRKQQLDLQKAEYDQQQEQSKVRSSALGGVAQQYGIDPSLLTAYPEIGQKLVENKLIPKAKKLAFAPNGVAYDENDPNSIEIGTQYAKPETASRSSLSKMIDEMNALPQGHPARSVYQKAINKEVNFAPPMVVQNYPAPMAAINPATGKQELIQFGNKGDAKPTGFEPVPSSANLPSEGERKASTLLQRLDFSRKQLDASVLEDKMAAKPNILGQSLSSIGFDTASNIVNSPNRQRVEAAQEDILDAALTLGTGAAYTKEQLKGYRKSYFPQIGDDAATVADKKDRLSNVIKAAETAAGRANIISKDEKMPTNNQPKSKQFDVGGKKELAVLGADGEYYVTKGGKKYRVEE